MAKLTDKRLFLLDLDGTLYLDRTLFPSTLPFLRQIRAQGGRYLFLTNNSSRSVADYVDKLAGMGIPADEEDFLTSTDALIAHLKAHPPYKLCYAFGTRSFQRQLRQAGIPVTDQLEDGIDCLLVGFDTELTFQKLEDACILLGRGVDFLATNPDWVCPTWYGSVPDCGSVCEMLTRATGRKPTVVGKPQPDMVRLAMERTGFPPEQTLLVGDRLYTDIACGAGAGVDTVFVLSGEGTADDLSGSEVQPTWMFGDVGALAAALETGEAPRMAPSQPASGQAVPPRRSFRALKSFLLVLLSLAGIIGCSIAAVWLLSSVFHVVFEDVLMTGIRVGFMAWLILFLIFGIWLIWKKQKDDTDDTDDT